ncbi:hypothetical protein FF2_000780 [Malus domestica]
MAIYIVSRWAAGVSTPLPALRFTTSLRPYSTKFERKGTLLDHQRSLRQAVGGADSEITAEF